MGRQLDMKMYQREYSGQTIRREDVSESIVGRQLDMKMYQRAYSGQRIRHEDVSESVQWAEN